jgi:Crinkler effector protein N-terminal domain
LIPHNFSLNCFLYGDAPDRTFTVKIPKTENISILKDRIKEKNPSSLGNVDAKNIDLWQVSFPIDDLPSKNPTTGPKLRSEKLLSDVFPSELDINHAHVVAVAPGQGEYYIDSGLTLLIIPSTRTLSYLRATAICI